MKYIHVITFDVPYPPNYGGVIVVYYHLKALAAAGVRVILHSFVYDERPPAPELEQFCEQTYYYPRQKNIRHFFSKKPFIVASRCAPKLLERLKEDSYPIFFEGHHSCFYLGHPALKNRKKIVRVHNIEAQYYRNLADLESNPLKKSYFIAESKKLQMFDNQVIRKSDVLIALAPDDVIFYKKKLSNTHYIPPFHADSYVNALVGKGDYLLFQGKLNVRDNEKAALFLVQQIAPQVDFLIKIVGLNPSQVLQNAVAKQTNVTLHANVSDEEMHQLSQQAQIHFLWTYQKAGMKLKLLKALFSGRHCIAHPLMVENTGLDKLCHICAKPTELIPLAKRLMKTPFVSENIEQRRLVLEKDFSNQVNIQKTINLIWK